MELAMIAIGVIAAYVVYKVEDLGFKIIYGVISFAALALGGLALIGKI